MCNYHRRLLLDFLSGLFTIILHSSLVLEEEKKSGFYSPEFDPDTCESQAKFGHSGSPSSSSITHLVPSLCNVGTSEGMEQSRSTNHEGDDGTIHSKRSSIGEAEIIGTPIKGQKSSQDELCPPQKLSVADVMCIMCKQLLFQPVVLNCGHGTQSIYVFFHFKLIKTINNRTLSWHFFVFLLSLIFYSIL